MYMCMYMCMYMYMYMHMYMHMYMYDEPSGVVMNFIDGGDIHVTYLAESRARGNLD